MTLFGVRLDPTNLGPMSVPFPLCIIYLKEMDQYGYQEALRPFLTLDSNFRILGRC